MTLGNPRAGRGNMRRQQDIVQTPQQMLGRQGLGLVHVQGRTGNDTTLQSCRQRVQLHDRTAPDVDEVSRSLHGLESLGTKPTFGLRSMRSGDHDEVAGRQQLVHPFHTPDVIHHPRHTARQRIDTQHSHSKPRRPTTDLGSDRTDSHHPHRAIGQVQVARINPADPARSTQKVRPLGLTPDRCPRPVHLLPQINV